MAFCLSDKVFRLPEVYKGIPLRPGRHGIALGYRL